MVEGKMREEERREGEEGGRARDSRETVIIIGGRVGSGGGR